MTATTRDSQLADILRHGYREGEEQEGGGTSPLVVRPELRGRLATTFCAPACKDVLHSIFADAEGEVLLGPESNLADEALRQVERIVGSLLNSKLRVTQKLREMIRIREDIQ